MVGRKQLEPAPEIGCHLIPRLVPVLTCQGRRGGMGLSPGIMGAPVHAQESVRGGPLGDWDEARRLCENTREEGPATNGTLSISIRGFYLTAAAAAATATAFTTPALPAVALAATASFAPTTTTSTKSFIVQLFTPLLTNRALI